MSQYKIINLGTFSYYTPDNPVAGKLYARHDGDNVDFNAFVNDPNNFTPNLLKMILIPRVSYENGSPVAVGGYSIGGVSYDASKLSVPYVYGTPLPFLLVEIADFVGFDPFTVFTNQNVDLDSVPGSAVFTTMSGSLPPSVPSFLLLYVYKRATKYEAEVVETILDTLSIRERRILEQSPNGILMNTPLFQDLAAQFISAFGRPRAQVLAAQMSYADQF